MQQISFKKGEELKFFQTLRERVEAYFREKQLSRNANSAMVIKSVILISAYILPFVAMLVFDVPFGISLLLWLLMGWAMAGVGMSVMHDANHGAYSANPNVNRILGRALDTIGGTAHNWNIQHNYLHHTYTNIAGVDEDIASKAIIRFSPHSRRRAIHRSQWWYAFILYAISTIYWALIKDFKQHFAYRAQGLHKGSNSDNNRILLGLIFTKVMYFFVFLVLPVLLGLTFWKVLVGFILMHVTCGLILSLVFQLAHTVEETAFDLPDSAGNMRDSWAVHQMRTTMNFACHNKWLSWYVGGLNFQIEHHLFTKVCHVHYPAIAPIVKATANEFGVPYLEKRTFGGAIRSHVSFLKSLGRLPSLDDLFD